MKIPFSESNSDNANPSAECLHLHPSSVHLINIIRSKESSEKEKLATDTNTQKKNDDKCRKESGYRWFFVFVIMYKK